MTERRRRAVTRSANALSIGTSAVAWDGDALTIEIDEHAAPLPKPIRGRVRLHPRALPGFEMTLDPAQHHRWSPIAPSARVEVALSAPALAWSGEAYLDTNHGERPLERDFSAWTWSRTTLGTERAILYDAANLDGSTLSLGVMFGGNGLAQRFVPPPIATLPKTGWGIRRVTRSDPAFRPVVRQTLEDGPFYARSLIATRLLGQEMTAIHESLSLERFSAKWVQCLLPFRMPRWAR